VTGSGRGIGRELCLEVAKTGATVVCWSRSAKPNEEVVEKIRSRGGKAFAYTVDVSNRGQVESTAALVMLIFHSSSKNKLYQFRQHFCFLFQVRKEIGEVSVVINNAGLMRILPFLETPPEDIESMFQVNVLSNFWVMPRKE